MTDPPRVCVIADPFADAAMRARAATLAAELGVPRAMRDEAGPFDAALAVTPAGLELRVLRATGGGGEHAALMQGRPVRVDLSHIDITSGPGRSLRQPLLRAVGLRRGEAWRPRVLDLTAGFGEDAYLLAGMGCDVTAVERNPLMAALLRDAVERATADDDALAERLRVVRGEARAVLGAWRGERAEVVYLDPMFPGGRRAMERKPMRVARWLVGDDADADDLLGVALHHAMRRVVVKRPTHAPVLAGVEPVTSHRGKAVRYDVYTAAGAWA